MQMRHRVVFVRLEPKRDRTPLPVSHENLRHSLGNFGKFLGIRTRGSRGLLVLARASFRNITVQIRAGRESRQPSFRLLHIARDEGDLRGKP